MSRVAARFAGTESAVPYPAYQGPSIGTRIGDAIYRAVRELSYSVLSPGSRSGHGARRRGSTPTSYTLAVAVLASRAAASVYTRARSRTAASRVAALRRRSAAERRLVTAFVLSLVLVASFLADARPLEPLGSTDGAGVGESASIVGLDAIPDYTVSRDLSTGESSDAVDPGVRFNPATVEQDASATTTNGGAPYLPDGTLLKPVAVNGALPSLVRTDIVRYTVRSGDTLTGIASRYHVTMKTLWWANSLTSKDALKVGQVILIPPVTGILWTVKEGDTLESIAATSKSDVQTISEYNDLTSDTLIIGMQLMIPDGEGAPLPTVKPAAPAKSNTSSNTSGGSSGGSVANGGPGGSGTLRWPVDGGYISQYFWSGHKAIDIAADYGTRVFAAAYGKVIWAGWRSNCGGYQIWVDHGNGLWTTYNHLSAILVGVGSYVGRGQTIARVGESGCATGPHLHFAVWRGGPPYAGGAYEVNPLNYL
jgi:murein DD-endopeptidase MepM/ murein hydrolase activator NlpD